MDTRQSMLSEIGVAMAIFETPQDVIDFLDSPLPAGQRSLDKRTVRDLMASDDLEDVLKVLRFLRAAAQGIHMPPNQVDVCFQPYTDSDISSDP